MQTNVLPKYDMRDNPTHCCPRFKPEDWDEKILRFENKLFVKVKTKSIFHIPINMGSVFKKIMTDIKQEGAFSANNFIVLSNDLSAWKSEHYFAVSKSVLGYEMVILSGDFLTKVFEGPYKKMSSWVEEMEKFVRKKGYYIKKNYFFYTACPKCAKFYGKNYIVAVSEVK